MACSHPEVQCTSEASTMVAGLEGRQKGVEKLMGWVFLP